MRELQYALRRLRGSPMFTVAATLTMAIAIGLGARAGEVVGTVLRRALMLTGAGIALGSVTAWLLARTLASLFIGVSPHDSTILVGAATLFAVVALAAAGIPAVRMTRIAPIVALTST